MPTASLEPRRRGLIPRLLGRVTSVAVGASLLTLAGVVVNGDAIASPQSAFISRLVKPAQQSQRSTGVPASVTIAQAILESGWGGSGLSTQTNNYFGIKCGSVRSPYQSGCASYHTKEYVNGRWVTEMARFRTYASVSGSVQDHARFLTASRYKAAFSTSHPDKFAAAIARAGYATDPSYASQLSDIMRRFNLYRYDVLPAAKTVKVSAVQTVKGTITAAQPAKVRAAQSLLAAKGLAVKVSGKLDAATLAAVRKHQSARGLAVTGKLDPRTVQSLTVMIRPGDTGAAVTAAQTLLQAKGHKLALPGPYGPTTKVAVHAFQKSKQLTVDGLVGPRTWAGLFN